MKITTVIRQPQGLLLSTGTGVAALILGLPLPVALLAGISVLAVHAGAVPVLERLTSRVSLAPTELDWMQRADRAVAAFRQLARTSRSEPIGQRCMVIGESAL